MSSNFYDKVAKKFGGYAFGKSHVDHLSEYPDGDPEKIFKKKLLGLANKNKIVLDAKAKKFITKEDYFQMMRYLRIANIKLGLIVNFRNTFLKPKRVLYSQYYS